MAHWESVFPPGTSFLPLVLILLYLIGIIFSWVNYAVFFSVNIDIYSINLVGAYLAFCIIGTLVYIFLSSVLWIRAARYITKLSHRLRIVLYGLSIIFFFKDLPLFIIECNAIMRFGWHNGYQGFCFVVQICFFIISLICIWLAFIWFITTCLERRCGTHYSTTRPKLGEILIQSAPPPMMLQETPYQNNYNNNSNPTFLIKANPPHDIGYSNANNHSRASLDRWNNSSGYI